MQAAPPNCQPCAGHPPGSSISAGSSSSQPSGFLASSSGISLQTGERTIKEGPWSQQGWLRQQQRSTSRHASRAAARGMPRVAAHSSTHPQAYRGASSSQSSGFLASGSGMLQVDGECRPGRQFEQQAAAQQHGRERRMCPACMQASCRCRAAAAHSPQHHSACSKTAALTTPPPAARQQPLPHTLRCPTTAHRASSTQSSGFLSSGSGMVSGGLMDGSKSSNRLPAFFSSPSTSTA